MRRIVLLLTVLVLAAGLTVSAAPPRERRGGPLGGPHHGPHGFGGMPSFEKDLFPPDMVLSNQLALELTDAQLKAVRELLQETHGRVLDLQIDLQRVTERLGALLEPARVDVDAALAAAEEAMTLESQVKRTHLGLLMRVKNLLTEEQQAKLRELRRTRPAEPRP